MRAIWAVKWPSPSMRCIWARVKPPSGCTSPNARGLGLGCGQPLSMTIAYNRSPAGREGEVTGLRLTANNVARVVIPVVCGALGTALGAAPVFWFNALNLTAVSFLVWRQ